MSFRLSTKHPLLFPSILLLLVGSADVIAAEPPWNFVVITVATHPGRASTTDRIHSMVSRSGNHVVRLDTHYAMPTVRGTQVAMLTGKYPSRWGLSCDRDTPQTALPRTTATLASLLREQGYRTAFFGDWHLGGDREQGPRDYGFNDCGDPAVATIARWIDAQSAAAPFLLYVATGTEDARVDVTVDTVLSRLGRMELRSQTLLLVVEHAADSGANRAEEEGDGGLLCERNIRGSAWLSWPGASLSRQQDFPRHVVDWLPTCLEIVSGANQASRRCGDGQSLLPWLKGEDTRREPRTLYWVAGSQREAVAVRHGAWKIVRRAGGEWNLYKIADDPGEKRNVAARHPEKLREMVHRHEWEWAQDGGVQALFESLDGWMTWDGQPAGPAWEVKEGEIHLNHAAPRSGMLISRRPVGDFDLRFEWRVAAGGNNGIKYRVRSYGDSWRGCEYQMIDDFGYRHPLPPEGTSAALYALYPPNRKKQLRPIETYNTARIRVANHRVEHWLNGERIVTAEIRSPEWYDRVVKSKFAVNAAFGENAIGRLMLTEHGSDAWFRNIRFTPLPMGGEARREYMRLVMDR